MTRSIAATIAPRFTQPTQVYQLEGVAVPAMMAGAVHVDSTLRLVFDRPPVLGTGGTIRVFRQADDALVDVIRLSGETDMPGYPGQDPIRKVNTTPIQIAGNAVTIKLHSNKLDYNTAYYVAIADGVFTGTSLGGVPFRGIGKLGGWSFSTRAAAPGGTSVTVDDDGAADFRTVQGALSYAMKHFSKAEPVTIQVMNGEYEELLYFRGKDNVGIVGQSPPGGTSSYDNIAFINTRMDRHVAPAGWAGLGVNSQPAPNPVLPTALSGWRGYGSTDLAGVPLDLARRVGGYLLRSDEVEAGFSTRAKVFAAYGNGAGWNPQP